MSYQTDSRFTRPDSAYSKQTLWKKCKEEPLVPFGALATAGVLTAGIRSFQQGNSYMQQIWMRWRVGLQMFTLGALFTYAYAKGKTTITQGKSEWDESSDKTLQRYND